MDLAGKRRRRGISCASITKLKTKVEVWVNKENLTAIDLLAVQQAERKLETLDVEFRQRHEAVVDELENDEELEYEQTFLDDHDNKVTYMYITVHLDHLTNHEESSVSVKLEGETQQLLHKRLGNIERSIRRVNVGIEPITPGPDVDRCLLE